MTIADHVQRAPKVTFINMSTNEVLEAQFNPSTFDEDIAVNYAALTVPGLSHQVLQFIHTNNMKYGFELFFHAVNGGPTELERIREARKFLLSVCHPRQATTILRGGAPRVLFVWPGIVALSCVVRSLKFKHNRFNKLAEPIAFLVKVMLEEIRDLSVSSAEIRATGTQRGAPDGGGL